MVNVTSFVIVLSLNSIFLTGIATESQDFTEFFHHCIIYLKLLVSYGTISADLYWQIFVYNRRISLRACSVSRPIFSDLEWPGKSSSVLWAGLQSLSSEKSSLPLLCKLFDSPQLTSCLFVSQEVRTMTYRSKRWYIYVTEWIEAFIIHALQFHDIKTKYE